MAVVAGFVLLSSKRSGIGAVKLKKTGWFDPYTENDKGVLVPAFDGPWTGKAGVYQIRDGSRKVIYVGSSTSQLKKTIYRHFQQWTDRQRSTNREFDRVVYPKHGYQIKFVIMSASDALRAEKYLIRKLQPRDNPIKYHGMTAVEVKKAKVAAEKIADAEMIPDMKNLPW